LPDVSNRDFRANQIPAAGATAREPPLASLFIAVLFGIAVARRR